MPKEDVNKSMYHSDLVEDSQLPFYSVANLSNPEQLSMLSLFSGCGGMDLGFEGGFICHKKSVPVDSSWIQRELNDAWVLLKKNRFKTVFANDILKEAMLSWNNYMARFDADPNIYHFQSIVDLVKLHKSGVKVFPDSVDIVTGGFPCQDFSVAGKRRGFDSGMMHDGSRRTDDEPSEESRGKLYYWMKQVIDIVKPKVFIAENVKGLVNLGDVKTIIQRDFGDADGGVYSSDTQGFRCRKLWRA